MKPTAKAATTVVSTPSAAITGRSAPCRRRAACRRRRSRRSSAGPRGGGASASAATPTPPAPAGRRAPGPRRRGVARSKPSGRRAARAPRRRTAATSARLIWSFVRQRVDLALDEGALALGLRRLGGEVERRAAHRAHHLVLDVAQGGPRAGGRADGARERAQQRARAGQGAPHDALPAAAAARCGAGRPRRPARARLAAMRPLPVDHERLRVGDDAEVVEGVAALVAQHRVGEVVTRGRRPRRRRRRRARRRRAPCRPGGSMRRCQRSSSGDSVRQGTHHEAQKLSTTTLPR